MGQAKRRGTYEERKASAVTEGRTKEAKAARKRESSLLTRIPSGLVSAFLGGALFPRHKKQHL